LPFARIGSAVSSNAIGQMRCPFGQMRRLTKRALHWHSTYRYSTFRPRTIHRLSTTWRYLSDVWPLAMIPVQHRKNVLSITSWTGRLT